MDIQRKTITEIIKDGLFLFLTELVFRIGREHMGTNTDSVFNVKCPAFTFVQLVTNGRFD